MAVLAVAIAWTAVPAACGPDDGGRDSAADECVQGLSAACEPLYEPVFDDVFARTLRPTCAVAGGKCHAADGAKAGLIFDDPDGAHERLLGEDLDGWPRVLPGDPACSVLVERLEDLGAARMPPGGPLPEAERCAIQRWIADGALR